MVYFIDTNIGIGYSIFPDKFHNPCKDFINESSNDIYWSNGVYEEFDRKFCELLSIIENFLDIISHALNNRQSFFPNKDSFASFVLAKTKKVDIDDEKKFKLIDVFWEMCNDGFSNDICVFQDKFEGFSLYVPSLFYERKNLLIEKLICHNCGLDNYKKYAELKELLKNNNVHFPDYKFILDAHDLGNDFEVFFVTNDKKMINAIVKNNLLDKLFIENFKVLN